MPAAPNSPIPPEKIDRYDSLLKRAQDRASAPNERDVALRAMRKMEEEYPGIQMVYLARRLSEQAADRAEERFGPGGREAAQAAAQAARDMYSGGVGWDQVLNRLGEFGARYVDRVAKESVDGLFRLAEEGLELATGSSQEEEETMSARSSRTRVNPAPKPRTPKLDANFWSGSDLEQLLTDYVEVEEVEPLDDDDGYQVYEMLITVPIPLIERCVAKAKEAQALVRFILDEAREVVTNGEVVEDDEDEDDPTED